MKKEEKLKEERLAELLSKADGHPMMKAILAEEATRILKTRQEAAGKIDILEAQLQALPDAEEAVSELKAELSILEERQKVLKQKINEKWAALRSEKLNIENEIGRGKIILIESCDPIIDEAITFFQERREVLLRKSPDKQTRRGGVNVFTMTKELTTFSNVVAIKSALFYCLNSIRTLEVMRFEPVLDMARIDELKRNIPDVDAMEESKADKPLPRVNTDPRILLPLNSELDWKLGKLTEKFKKVMGRKGE